MTGTFCHMQLLCNDHLALDQSVNRLWKWHDSKVAMLGVGDLNLFAREVQIFDA